MQVNSALAERRKFLSFFLLFIFYIFFLSWFYTHYFICLLAGRCCEFGRHHGTSDLSVYKCRMTLIEVRFTSIFLPPCSVIAAYLFQKQRTRKKNSKEKLFLSLKLPTTKRQHFQIETFLRKFQPEWNCFSCGLKLWSFLMEVLT